MYSCPLNNTGWNYAGLLIWGFVSMNIELALCTLGFAFADLTKTVFSIHDWIWAMWRAN